MRMHAAAFAALVCKARYSTSNLLKQLVGDLFEPKERHMMRMHTISKGRLHQHSGHVKHLTSKMMR